MLSFYNIVKTLIKNLNNILQKELYYFKISMLRDYQWQISTLTSAINYL